ncbi:MAG: HAD-IB family phosphatase [Nitrososphaeria archaeon]
MAYKLIFFDLDGTLIKCKSSWELIHKQFGTVQEAKRALEEYRLGKISYQQFMVRDISSWLKKKKTIHISEIKEILKDYEFNKGARETVSQLKERGLKIAVLTAGIDILAEDVGKQLNADIVLANKLEVDKKGYLTGKGIEFVDPYRKDQVLISVSNKENVPLRETIAVGDTIYDISMLKTAGLGLYFGNKGDIKNCNIKPIHSLKEVLNYL